MIRVIGTPGDIHAPKVTIGSEPVASFSVQYPAGQMARCVCGVRPESVSDVKGGGALMVDGEILFTGIGWAPRGRASSSTLDFGFSLIHPAHVLDEGRAWAPGLHPMSTEHYTFTMGGGGADTRDSSLFGDYRLIKFNLQESLATEIPSYIRRAMERAEQQRVGKNLEWIAIEGSVAQNNKEVLEFLDSIEGLTDCKLDIKSLSDVGLSTAADAFCQSLVMNSITANKSAWDLVAMLFSAFGMQMICWPDGTMKVCPDFSGCKPPEGNRISGAIVDAWDGAAEYNRSPRGVVVISFGFSRAESATKPTSGEADKKPIPQKHGEYIPEKSGGALFVTGIPNWMVPHQQGGLPDIPEDAIEKYAKQIYAEIKNMGRSFVISTPLCPMARPGTVYYFEPISNAKNLTEGGGNVETPFSAEYAGYCYKVEHTGNTQGQFHTHWHFRNVFEPDEYDLMVDKAPFFGDTPFEVGEGDSTSADDEFNSRGSEMTQTGQLSTGTTQTGTTQTGTT
jgi:hypothetical protein